MNIAKLLLIGFAVLCLWSASGTCLAHEDHTSDWYSQELVAPVQMDKDTPAFGMEISRQGKDFIYIAE